MVYPSHDQVAEESKESETPHAPQMNCRVTKKSAASRNTEPDLRHPTCNTRDALTFLRP